MRSNSITTMFFITLFAFACGITEERQMADKVYYNGNIYTVATDNKVEAVATLDGTILFVGSTDKLQSYIDSIVYMY